MGRSGSRLWKYAAAVGVMGLLMMMAAILVANRWENMFGIAVLLGLVCTWIALLMLAVAWVRELWYSFCRKDYLTMVIWLALGLLILILSGRRGLLHSMQYDFIYRSKDRHQSLQGINFPMIPPTIAGTIQAKPMEARGRDFTKPVGRPKPARISSALTMIAKYVATR